MLRYEWIDLISFLSQFCKALFTLQAALLKKLFEDHLQIPLNPCVEVTLTCFKTIAKTTFSLTLKSIVLSIAFA